MEFLFESCIDIIGRVFYKITAGEYGTIRLNSALSDLLEHPIKSLLKNNGISFNMDTSLAVQLPAVIGMKLALIFAVVDDDQEQVWIEDFVKRVSEMDQNETEYWFRKCFCEPTPTRARTAFKVLFG